MENIVTYKFDNRMVAEIEFVDSEGNRLFAVAYERDSIPCISEKVIGFAGYRESLVEALKEGKELPEPVETDEQYEVLPVSIESSSFYPYYLKAKEAIK